MIDQELDLVENLGFAIQTEVETTTILQTMVAMSEQRKIDIEENGKTIVVLTTESICEFIRHNS